MSLPAVDRPNLPFADLSQPKGPFAVDYRKLDLYQQHRFDGPLAIAFEDRLLVMPDVLLKRSAEGHVIMYPTWSSEPGLARFVSKGEYEKLQKLPNTQTIEAKHQPNIPVWETGRHDEKDC